MCIYLVCVASGKRERDRKSQKKGSVKREDE